MQTHKYRKAYQPTLYRYENGRVVARLTAASLFAMSVEARCFAEASHGWRSGRYTSIRIATKLVSSRQYESVVSLSVVRAA